MTRDELQAIPRRERQILRMEEQLVYFRHRAVSTAVLYEERVQSSGVTQSGMYSAAAVDLERSLGELKATQSAAKSEARERISALSDPQQRLVLLCRYVDCMSGGRLVEFMGVSMRQIYRLLNAGMDELFGGTDCQ